MKKILFVALLLALSTATLKAQLANTKWTGIVTAGEQVTVIWDFKKDTVQVFMLPDSTLMETMIYHVEDKNITFQKVSGTSPCPNSVIGKYKLELKDDKMLITPIEDDCDARKMAANPDGYTRIKM